MLTSITAKFSAVGGGVNDNNAPLISGSAGSGYISAPGLIAFINIAPVLVWLVGALQAVINGSCNEAMARQGEGCRDSTILFDAVGLVTCRIARVDMGLSILFAARGWLIEFTDGWLGYPEGIPIHRILGFWCIGHSMAHSVCYLALYIAQSGWDGLVSNCFPASLPNTLGIINFFGVLAFGVSIPLIIYSTPWVRKRVYHQFQRLHLPLAGLFLVACCLHDFQILYFCLPGLAYWYLGRRQEGGNNKTIGVPTSMRLLGAVKLLEGSSGPWVELSVNCSDLKGTNFYRPSPRGQWGSVRIDSLGNEFHPLSMFTMVVDDTLQLSTLVSANAGNWSRDLVELAKSGRESLNIDVEGLFPVGGGNWSFERRLEGEGEPEGLLLFAGGTGIGGFLQGVNVAAATGRKIVHLVWCVKELADYENLARRLPICQDIIAVTIFVTGEMVKGSHDQLYKRSELLKDTKFFLKGGTLEGANHSVLAVLAPTVLSLVVGHWVWETWLASNLGLSDSLLTYVIVKRFFPILLVVATMAFVFATISFRTDRGVLTTDLDGENENDALLGKALSTCQYDDTALLGQIAGLGHEIKQGRPCISDMIVQQCKIVKASNASKLVISACGPIRLVKAVEKEVESIAEDCRRDESVALTYFGPVSLW